MNTLTNGLPDADAARIASRYPAASPLRRWAPLGIGALAALFLGWVVWAGIQFAASEVAGRVATVTIVDQFHSTAVLHVDRSDPRRPASCHVVAKSEDYQVVAELDVPVPPSPDHVTSVTVEIRTVRTPAAVEVTSCVLP